MHDVFEEVLQYEAKLFLRHAITDRKYFSSNLLRQKMEYMELGYMETSDRPTPFPSQVL